MITTIRPNLPRKDDHKCVMEQKIIHVKEQAYDEYNYKANKDNEIRQFLARIIREMPKNLQGEVKFDMVELKLNPIEHLPGKDIVGVKRYKFLPTTASKELYEYMKKFIVFVEEE